MEPQALKDYLESLLNEHNQRFLGGILKNSEQASLCYKEVLPASAKGCAPQPAAPEACPSAKQPKADASAVMELYQNYALNALKNLASMIAPPAPEACQTSMNIKPASCTPAVKAEEEVASCMPAKVSSQPACAAPQIPQEIMEIDLLISQQLERIEHMIREMYITNQELFKSIITYCRTYTIEENDALDQ